MPKLSAVVLAHDGVIVAIRVKVLVCKSCRSCCQSARVVRIDEPADLCVVVSRIEVVEARFGIVVITSVTERVVRAERRSH